MRKILLAGAGRVGRAIALDLASEYHLTIVDPDPRRLTDFKGRDGVEAVCGDVRQPELRALVSRHDLAIGAVPGFAGFEVLKCLLESAVGVVDISFFDEDPFQLGELAQRRGVSAVVDCGLAPGLCNLFLGYVREQGDVGSYRCLVGGLPRDKTALFHYKAPFSPVDVLEEYRRPARVVESGQIRVRPALSDPEIVHFDGVGELEAFNTDGLRTLLTVGGIDRMVEKTLRYPGHRAAIEVLRDAGLLETESVDIGGLSVRPLDVTAHQLLPRWELDEGEPEFSLMRVEIDAADQSWVFDLFDETDLETGTSSMARTTGFTCTAVARLLLEEAPLEPGVWAPEHLGAHYDWIRQSLADRNVTWSVQTRLP